MSKQLVLVTLKAAFKDAEYRRVNLGVAYPLSHRDYLMKTDFAKECDLVSSKDILILERTLKTELKDLGNAKEVTILKEVFLNWYFKSGSDKEQEEAYTSLGKKVVEELLLMNTFKYTTEDVFKECEVSCVPLRLLEEFSSVFKDTRHVEIGDLEGQQVHLKLK